MTSLAWCCKLVIQPLGNWGKRIVIWRSMWDSVKKNCCGCSLFSGLSSTHETFGWVSSIIQICCDGACPNPRTQRESESATPFESEANFGFQTSSQNKQGWKWRLTQQVRALAALTEFPAHTSGSTQLPLTPALGVPTPIWCRYRWAGVHTHPKTKFSTQSSLSSKTIFVKQNKGINR